MSPHNDGQLPPAAPRRSHTTFNDVSPSVIFDAPCPGCGEECEWYGDGQIQKTVPGHCRTCTSRLPGCVKLREVNDRLVAEGHTP